MDPAWAGVIGGGIGVLGTLGATALTLWRTGIQRDKDRVAETERQAEQRRADAEQWQREREAARADAIEDHWTGERRRVFMATMGHADRWRTVITHNLSAKNRDDPGYPVDWPAYTDDMSMRTEMEQHLIDMLPLADREVRGALVDLWTVLVNASITASLSPSITEEQRADLSSRAGREMQRFMRVCQAKLGIISRPGSTSALAGPEVPEVPES